MGFVSDIFGKGAPTPPPAPDYNAIAKTQGAANEETARTQARLNNPNINNVYGSQSVSYAKSPVFDQAGYDAAMKAYQSGQPTTQFDQAAYDKALAAYNTQPQATPGAPQYIQQLVGGGQGIEGATYQSVLNPAYKAGATGAAPSRDQFIKTIPFSPSGAAPSRDQFTTYTENPDQATITQTLSPEQQKLYDQQIAISQQLGQTAQNQLGQVSNAMATPFDMSKLTQRSGLPTIAGPVAGPNVGQQTAAAQYGAMPQTSNFQNFNERSQYGAMPQADAEQAQRVAQAMYLRAAQPMAYQNLLQNNQAMTGGHNLGGNAMNAMADNQNRGWNDLALGSILAGGQEQSRLFDLEMRQAQLGDTRQNTLYGQGLQNAGFNNQNAANLYGQQFQNAQLGDTRANNQFSQTEAAKAAQFAQELAARQFQSGENINQFNQGAQLYGLSGNARAQDLQEQAYLRSLPLSELNALRTGAQPTVPQFQQYTGGGNIAPPPIMQGAITDYQSALGPYNAQLAQNNAMTNGLFSLGSAWLGA